MALEELVRPYQSRDLNRGLRIVTSRERSTKKAEIKWGATGTLPTPKTDDGGFQLCAETYDESSRKTETLRVENPNDSSQFVKVKRVKKMKLSKSAAGKTLQSGLTADLHQDWADFNAAFRDSFTPLDANGEVDDNCEVEINFNN